MEDDIFSTSDDYQTVFRDLIFLVLVGFVVMLILVISHINPPTKEEESDAIKIGSVVVDVIWPSKLDADVDLWVKSPGDKRPVGYSNRAGKIFNLLRDDRGNAGDVTEINYEVASTRGAPAGEYIINLHLYRSGSNVTLPLENIIVSATYRRSPQAKAIKIFKKVVVLTRQGEEITIVRFRLTEEGTLEPGSLHNIPIKLRSLSSGGRGSWSQ